MPSSTWRHFCWEFQTKTTDGHEKTYATFPTSVGCWVVELRSGDPSNPPPMKWGLTCWWLKEMGGGGAVELGSKKISQGKPDGFFRQAPKIESNRWFFGISWTMNSMKGLIGFQNVRGGVCHQISEAWKKSMEVRFTELDETGLLPKKNRLPEKVWLEGHRGTAPMSISRDASKPVKPVKHQRNTSKIPGKKLGEVRSDTVDGRHPAPPRMYRTL